jgi:L-lactate utilization protein LutC
MKKKVIKLTESELKNYIQKIIMEQNTELPMGDLAEQSSDIDMERLKRERDRLKKELANLEAQIGSKPNTKKSRTDFDDFGIKKLTSAGFKKVQLQYHKNISSGKILIVELYTKGCSVEYPGFTFYINDKPIYQGCPDECWVWFDKNLKKYEQQ